MNGPQNNSGSQRTYWLNNEVDQIIAQFPAGEIIVSSGISPSATYHIGHFREVLMADGLAWGIRQRGRQARHLHFVDNFDPLRKRYDFLPVEYEQYIGWPICLIPAPDGSKKSYATYFSEEFQKEAAKMGVDMEVIYSYEDQYLNGKMVPMIEQAVAHGKEIRKIFDQVANRQLSDDWMPIQILSDAKSFNQWRYKAIDTKTKTMTYVDEAGNEGEVSYADGRVKLNWRLDWPARWALWGVQVEPYGKEHATKGGSYDTGAEFVKQVFNAQPPYPLAYDTINLVGDNKKMSSSLGNLITPAEALEIMPPEIIRYLIYRNLPKRVVYFDSGLGLYNLIDEFSKAEEAVLNGQDHEFGEAYKVSAAINSHRTITSIPFNHLVGVYQAAQGDQQTIIDILNRTGYQAVVSKQKDVLSREIPYVANWLHKYAPESVKFSVQQKLPKLELSPEQTKFAAILADKLQAINQLDGQIMHQTIYGAKEQAGIQPGQAFKAIYQLLLNKQSGPKAGWFLSSLDKDWLIKRLRLQA
ncbi:MAG: lysine--tRNA ligase [Candidatus Saccharimonadales bacterium]